MQPKVISEIVKSKFSQGTLSPDLPSRPCAYVNRWEALLPFKMVKQQKFIGMTLNAHKYDYL